MLQTHLETERLMLRLFQSTDAKSVQKLAGHEEIARTTLGIPHPYPDGVAEAWIEHVRRAAERGEMFSFALIRKEDHQLIGCVSLRVKSANDGELAYWVGRPYWGQGFATEASKKVVNFGFEVLGLNRVYAKAMTKNPASYKVMSKIGMKYKETLSRHLLKSGVYEDLVLYEMTRPKSMI
ncbi:Protein N-acetyltransferase, RimJ/RimL family [Seinonella peptonophila]|uniref:Protein N-acetyltransferase, RimJ/RimL family n=1 Tax=Seinonella peptonophila TaxID=112248 RepID=A0A1M5B671_9BACL|nr:GNAT family N-acetyltransferase [Seinonella peptonophila]SHF37682.1 Protein N-acetyltransferase, RimJ/RimL family [Seinonella peptonophila]